MRADTANFAAKNLAPAKEPRYTVEIAFDSDNTILRYFTSHTDAATPPGATVVSGVVANISGTSQTLNPDRANATIGALSFDIVDKSSQITTTLGGQLALGRSTRLMRVRVYMGYEGLAWADYVLVQTQLVDEIRFRDGAYTFRCLDIQREGRKDIFELATTTLQTSVTDTDTTITVYDTSAFSLVAHGTSYSDAPSQTVGYIRIEAEVIRYTGKTATTFTGCIRGALNTSAAEHKVDADQSADRRPEVEEFVYLELPAAKLIYAILTGSLYGQGGATLPTKWHLGIPAAYVRTADFTAIGADLWDTADDNAGFVVRFSGLGKRAGKEFIEKELLLLTGLFMPVYGDGALGLKRMASVLAGAGYVKQLDESNIISHGELTHDFRALHNVMQIDWNYEPQKEETTRTNILIDSDSIGIYGKADLYKLKFLGLHGSRHTSVMLARRFDALRDRYSGPPLRVQVNCLPSLNTIEVGDVVRVKLDDVRDYVTNASLDRSFEVQNVSINWITGEVSLRLFASSRAAKGLAASSDATAIGDGWYTSAGTALSSVLTITGSNPGHVSANGTLTGGSDLNASGSIFYYAGDLVIDSGVTVALLNNVQLRIKGHLTINGKLDGKGGGHAGAVAPNPPTSPEHHTDGTIGAIGTTISAGGMTATPTSMPPFYFDSISDREGYTRAAVNATVPEFNIAWNGSVLIGLPTDLRGSSGSSGRVSYWGTLMGGYTYARAGDGGASGAGLAVVCRGASFGASGKIDVSGADGTLGNKVTSANANAAYHSGAGAGGSFGGALVLLDGQTAVYPDITTATAVGKRGSTPKPNATITDAQTWTRNNGAYEEFCSRNRGTGDGTVVPILDASGPNGAFRVQYVPANQAPAVDSPTYATKPISVALAEYPNTPKSPGANLSTIEVTVTPPSDTQYDYANIYVRKLADVVWQYSGPANDEWTFVVPSDGAIYVVQARAVSLVGGERADGPTAQITVAAVAATPSQSVTVPNVTGLELTGQGNDTEFVGREARFSWRKTSITEWVAFGAEPNAIGADAGALDQYFLDYEVRIFDAAGVELRLEHTTDNFYVYSYERNVLDGGPRREISIEVRMRSRQGLLSPKAARLSVNNPAPAVPGGLALAATFRTLWLEFTPPSDLDYQGFRAYLGTSSGFTKNASSLVYDGDGNALGITKLPSGAALAAGTTYYVAIQTYDSFGPEGTNSVELSATTLKIVGEYDIEAQSIKSAQIGLLQVVNALIGDMSADKINAGAINIAWSGGNIRSGQTAYNTGTGWWVGNDGGTPKFSIGNPGASKYITWDGSALTVRGALNADDITAGAIRGISVSAASHMTKGSYLTAALSGGESTVTVKDTTDFPSSGSGWFIDVTNDRNTFSWTGKAATTLTGCSGVLAHNNGATVVPPGKSIVIDAATNEMRFFGDRGDGTTDELGSIGVSQVGSDYIVANFGSSGSTRIGVLGRSNSYYGVYGLSASASGVYGYCTAASGTNLSGVKGGAAAGGGVGGLFFATSDTQGAPIRIVPKGSAGAPTHSMGKGSLAVDSDGILYINTSDSTTWQKVGAQ